MHASWLLLYSSMEQLNRENTCNEAHHRHSLTLCSRPYKRKKRSVLHAKKPGQELTFKQRAPRTRKTTSRNLHTQTHTHTHTYIHTYTYTHTHLHTHTYIHTYTNCTSTHAVPSQWRSFHLSSPIIELSLAIHSPHCSRASGEKNTSNSKRMAITNTSNRSSSSFMLCEQSYRVLAAVASLAAKIINISLPIRDARKRADKSRSQLELTGTRRQRAHK